MHGGPADLIVVDHARSMVVALQQAGVNVASVELPAEDHFTIAEWRVAGPWTLAFFAMVLHPER
jgi:hypothetical protein